MKKTRVEKLQKRHRRIRLKIKGTPERPRMAVHKSLKHLYVQVIDDVNSKTLASASTDSKAFRANGGNSFRNAESAKIVGKEIAEKAKAAGIESVIFDRGGFLFHGCIKSLADAAREAGLKF